MHYRVPDPPPYRRIVCRCLRCGRDVEVCFESAVPCDLPPAAPDGSGALAVGVAALFLLAFVVGTLVTQ